MAKTSMRKSRIQGSLASAACGLELSGTGRLFSTRRLRLRGWSEWTSFALLALMGTICAAPAPAAAQSAAAWSKRGEAAEVRDDFDGAYDAYLKAYQQKPKDLRYKTRYERVRFQAAAIHVERARKFRLAGQYSDALAECLRALDMDPSNQSAQQEITATRQAMAVGNQTGQPAVPVNKPEVPLLPDTISQLNSVAGPVELKPVSNDPITLHMVEDSKIIYQAIGKAAGLNVLFDPDYVSKRVPVDLTNVSLSDALRIAGTISGTFWKPVTPNTIFVAQNSLNKRRDLEQLAVQTFYLANASQQNDANEVVTAIRNLLDPSVKVFLVPSQNAIVMRATLDQLLLTQKLINDLDRARPEVVVDVAVLEVNRDKLRNIGIQFPQSFGVQLQSATQSTTTPATTTTTGATTTPAAGGLSLNDLAHLNATNFAVTVGQATANLLLSDNDTRILQNPRIRATDNQKASLKIGSRIPVATGSFGGAGVGVGAVGVSSLVQTQFTYLDVGVNIDMTPTVHYDHDVTLKLKIEVSSENGFSNLGGGLNEPIISQKIVDHTIRLKEGEVNILAGILQRTDTRSVSGTPGLGEIPLLKYLFSSQSHEVATDEVVFMLTPHIVRESVLSPLNLRQIDTGSGQGIEIRREPTLARAQADAASGMTTSGQGIAGPVAPPTAGPAANTNVNTAATAAVAQMRSQADAAAPLSLALVPSAVMGTVGNTFKMDVFLTGAQDLFSVPMQVQYDPKLVSLVNVDSGDLLGRDGQAVALVHRDDGNGNMVLNISRPPGVAGVNGQGTVVTLTFKAMSSGDTTVTLAKIAAKNSAQAPLAATGAQAAVHLQ